MFEWIYSPEAWIALVTLTSLEIVLGIDATRWRRSCHFSARRWARNSLTSRPGACAAMSAMWTAMYSGVDLNMSLSLLPAVRCLQHVLHGHSYGDWFSRTYQTEGCSLGGTVPES